MPAEPSRIRIVYQSCGENFVKTLPEPAERFFPGRQLPEQFFLVVGTVEERKNLLVAVQALERIPGISLVVVGRKKKYFQQVQEFLVSQGLEKRVHFPEAVTNGELAALYRKAVALVYPSRFEGFGIPVIEALSIGTPVIAANTSALPEAGGPSSLYFDPDDAEALAVHMQHLLDDRELRERMINDGRRYALQFQPAKTAADLMNLYEQLV